MYRYRDRFAPAQPHLVAVNVLPDEGGQRGEAELAAQEAPGGARGSMDAPAGEIREDPVEQEEEAAEVDVDMGAHVNVGTGVGVGVDVDAGVGHTLTDATEDANV